MTELLKTIMGRKSVRTLKAWKELSGNDGLCIVLDAPLCPGSSQLRPYGGTCCPFAPANPQQQGSALYMGILICGLNGAGKSTLGKMLAKRIGYLFIDNEDLYFPKEDAAYPFSGTRSKDEVIRLLEEKIAGNPRFIFASVKGDYGDKLIAALDAIILIDVPKEVRRQRIRARSYLKFGDRIMPGGDLYDQETAWFALTDSRPENYTTKWLETVSCPVICVDGVLPVEENVEYLASVLG